MFRKNCLKNTKKLTKRKIKITPFLIAFNNLKKCSTIKPVTKCDRLFLDSIALYHFGLRNSPNEYFEIQKWLIPACPPLPFPVQAGMPERTGMTQSPAWLDGQWQAREQCIELKYIANRYYISKKSEIFLILQFIQTANIAISDYNLVHALMV